MSARESRGLPGLLSAAAQELGEGRLSGSLHATRRSRGIRRRSGRRGELARGDGGAHAPAPALVSSLLQAAELGQASRETSLGLPRRGFRGSVPRCSSGAAGAFGAGLREGGGRVQAAPTGSRSPAGREPWGGLSAAARRLGRRWPRGRGSGDTCADAHDATAAGAELRLGRRRAVHASELRPAPAPRGPPAPPTLRPPAEPRAPQAGSRWKALGRGLAAGEGSRWSGRWARAPGGKGRRRGAGPEKPPHCGGLGVGAGDIPELCSRVGEARPALHLQGSRERSRCAAQRRRGPCTRRGRRPAASAPGTLLVPSDAFLYLALFLLCGSGPLRVPSAPLLGRQVDPEPRTDTRTWAARRPQGLRPVSPMLQLCPFNQPGTSDVIFNFY